jgi:hypothetical protein
VGVGPKVLGLPSEAFAQAGRKAVVRARIAGQALRGHTRELDCSGQHQDTKSMLIKFRTLSSHTWGVDILAALAAFRSLTDVHRSHCHPWLSPASPYL